MSYDFGNLICLTIDVEWACAEVLADVRRQLDDRNIRGTFFCTHPGVDVGPHERGLHPNFRRQGDTMKALGQQADDMPESTILRHVLETTHTFCPEATGVRTHSLFYDSELMPIYQSLGLQYDSSYLLPFASHLAPVQKEHGVLEFPIYYMDDFDLVANATGFRIEALHLDRPGLKVFDFHPNMLFINAETRDRYMRSKEFYHQPEALMDMRFGGKGVRTLFAELLDTIVARGFTTTTLGEANRAWRE